MRRTHWLGLALLVAAVAGRAADEAEPLLFLREGQVWCRPAHAEVPRQVIADDPGWVYSSPTWIDANRFLVMRLKNGELGRTHVGVVELVQAPVDPKRIRWLPKLGGSWGIGVNHAKHQLTFLKGNVNADSMQVGDATLGHADFDGHNPVSRSIGQRWGECYVEEHRLRWSSDGRYVWLPRFPTDVSSKIVLFDTETWRDAELPVNKLDWTEERCLTSGCFTEAGKAILGTLFRGLLEANLQTGAARQITQPIPSPDSGDWDDEVCLSHDGQYVYFSRDYDPTAPDRKLPRIYRQGLDQSSAEIELRVGSSPDVLPPWVIEQPFADSW